MSEYSSLKLFFLPLRLGVDDNESKEGNKMKNEPFMTFVSICLFRERFWEGKFAFLCVFFLFLCFCLRSTKKRTCEQAFFMDFKDEKSFASIRSLKHWVSSF